MLVDSHCHIDFPELRERMPELLGAMRDNGVAHALCACVTLEGLAGILQIAESHPCLFASVGVHPDHTEGEEPDVARLVALSGHPRVVAIGETGLDYYRLRGDLEWQRERFRVHVRAARAVTLPLIIHTRAASEDTLAIMRDEIAAEAGGVMHCFTETREVARAALDMGFYISFSGIVTFRNAQDLRDVACFVPLDRMLVETDSPYLAPVPHRGSTNEPAYVRHVAEEIARLHGIDLDAVASRTSDNFFRLFNRATRSSPES